MCDPTINIYVSGNAMTFCLYFSSDPFCLLHVLSLIVQHKHLVNNLSAVDVYGKSLIYPPVCIIWP